MSEPFLGELKCVAFNFPPKGWSLASGQLMDIGQNAAIFSLLGTTYGGDGQSTFGLPNLQGRAAVHVGNGIVLGQTAGEYNHTLIQSEMPAHNHTLQADNDNADNTIAGTHRLATTANTITMYAPPGNLVAMFGKDVSSVGGSQPHSNQSPYLVMSWIIALSGIFPSRT